MLLILWEQWDRRVPLQAVMVLVMSGGHDTEHIIRMYLRSYEGSVWEQSVIMQQQAPALKLSQGVLETAISVIAAPSCV